MHDDKASPGFAVGVSMAAYVQADEAIVFADAALLRSLKAGEERTLQTYHVVRETANAMVRKLISDTLIPAQVQHISDLEAILARL